MTTLELKLEKLRQVCERDPENSIGLLALAETAFRRGLRLEALEAYQAVLRTESVAEAHLCMAQMYAEHGLLEESVNEVGVLFTIEPGYPEAHVFARHLRSQTTLPDDMEAILKQGCSEDEVALARVRLSISRSMILREGQELTAMQDSTPNDPTYGYYIGETRKRLVAYETVLSQLADLEEARRLWLADPERHRRVDPVPAVEVQPSDEGEVEIEGGIELDPIAASEGVELVDIAESNQADTDEISVEIANSDEQPVLSEESENTEFVQLQEPLELATESTEVESSEELVTEEGHAAEEAFSEEFPTAEPHDLETAVEEPLEGDASPEQIEEGVELSEPVDTYAEQVVDTDEPEMSETEAEPEPEEPPATEQVEATEPEPAEIVMEEAVELAPDDAAEAPQEDFSAAYAALVPELDSLVQTLAKTRSVSSVYLLNRRGHRITRAAKDSMAETRISEFLVETVSFLESYAESPQYWVLECAGGIVVFQSIDSFHYLLIIGQTGANFGALRYTMDRIRPNFEQVLSPVYNSITS